MGLLLLGSDGRGDQAVYPQDLSLPQGEAKFLLYKIERKNEKMSAMGRGSGHIYPGFVSLQLG